MRLAMTRPLPGTTTRSRLASRVLVIGLVALFVFGTLGFIAAALSAGERQAAESDPPPPARGAGASVGAESSAPSSALPSPAASSTAPSASADPVASRSPVPSPSTQPEASPAAAAVGAEGEPTTMPVVPIARFWSSESGISRRDVRRALETGRVDGYQR